MPINAHKVDLPFIFLFFLFILDIVLVFLAIFFNLSFPPLAAVLLFPSVLHLFTFFFVTVFLTATFGSASFHFVGCPPSFSLWSLILTFILITNAATSLGGRFDISSLMFPFGCILFIVIILIDFVFTPVSTICTSSHDCPPPVSSPLGDAVYDRKKLSHFGCNTNCIKPLNVFHDV